MTEYTKEIKEKFPRTLKEIEEANPSSDDEENHL